MKDSEFIELLNLYLDHEISAADAVRLETEVQSHPERRRVYREYCQMQKACKMVGADFVTDVESAPAAGPKVVAFNPAARIATRNRQRTAGVMTWGGLAAAAACVALVFVNRTPPAAPAEAGAPAPSIAQASQPAPAASNADALAVTSSPRGFAPAPQRQHVVLVSNPLLLTEHTQAQAIAAAAARQADNHLAWLETLRLAPLPDRSEPTTNLQFSAQFLTESRALGGRAAMPTKQPEPGEEMVTFQFVK